MAEQSRKKRRLRAPSETVREKAVKAQEEAGAPTKSSAWQAFWRGIFWPLRIIWLGIAWLSHQVPLRQIGHGLRWFFSLKPFRVLALILGLKFAASSLREVKLVTWPTWRQSLRLTGAVIIFSVIFGSLIAAVDYGLDKLFKQIILK